MTPAFLKKRGAFETVGCKPRREVGFHAPLPAVQTRALDAEGMVCGKTWRQMKRGCYLENADGHISQPLQAIAWFWWKRGLATCFSERPSMAGYAERTAVRHSAAEEPDRLKAGLQYEEGEVAA